MEKDLYIIEFEAPEGTCYIEGFLRGQTLVITDIHVPKPLWRRGIGRSLVKQLKDKVGARRAVAYNIRGWGPAESFFESLDVPEVFTTPELSGERIVEKGDYLKIKGGNNDYGN